MDPEPALRGGPTLGSAVRVILYLLLGLVGVDLVVGAYRPLWKAYDPDNYSARLDVCRGRAYDLVVVGGSPVAEGADTRILAGLKRHGQTLDRAYNLGFLGGTATEFWHGVVNGVTVRPKLLVYGITATDLNDSRDEPHGAQSLMNLGDVLDMTWHRPRRVTWFARQFAVEHACRCWQLWYHRNAIRLWAADQFDRLWPGPFAEAAAEARQGLEHSAALAQDHGYAPDHATQARSFTLFTRKHRDSLVWNFLDKYQVGEHLHYVHRLFAWAKEHNVEIVLVDMPVSEELEKKRHPREFATYRAVLEKTEKECGVRVLRASREAVGLTDDDFGDLVHLNSPGSAKFSRWLRRQLEDPTTEDAGGSRP